MTIATSGPITMSSFNLETGSIAATRVSLRDGFISRLVLGITAGPVSMSQLRGNTILSWGPASSGASMIFFQSITTAAAGSLSPRLPISASAITDVKFMDVQTVPLLEFIVSPVSLSADLITQIRLGHSAGMVLETTGAFIVANTITANTTDFIHQSLGGIVTVNTIVSQVKPTYVFIKFR